jgi:hypothetical protein
MMLKDFVELYRNSSSETGLSVLGGSAIENSDDLPGHRIEIHVFRDGALAEAFVSGMHVVGLGNSVAVTHEAGTLSSNRIVIVAKFDEPAVKGDRPVLLIEHTASKADSEAISAGQKIQFEQDRMRHDQDVKDRAALVAMLETAGFSKFTFAHGWLRWDEGFLATWRDAGGPFKLTKEDWHLTQGIIDGVAVAKEIADREGIVFERDECRFVLNDLPDEKAVLAGVERLRSLSSECVAHKAKLAREQFVASVKLTPSRRRFLKAGLEMGVKRHINRGNLKARAGAFEIGQTEINTLVQIGWMSDENGLFSITDAGVEMSARPAAR